MAEKRFYWLKLKDDFFNLDTIDYLSSIPNGCEYIVLYQKLCLLTLNSNGRMCSSIGEMLIPFDENKIARDTKFSFDTVSEAIAIFRKIGLIFEEADGVMKIPYVEEACGSESSSASRVRKYRDREKALHSNANVTPDVTQIIDIDNRDKILDTDKRDNKKNYADAVTLTEEQFEKLLSEHSKPFVDKCIEVLNNYKLSSGKKYKSDYHAIINWVVGRVSKDYPQLAAKPAKNASYEDLFENPWADYL